MKRKEELRQDLIDPIKLSQLKHIMQAMESAGVQTKQYEALAKRLQELEQKEVRQ